MSSAFKTPKPDCYACAHRGTVPGSVHSSCNNPMAVVSADQHGIRMGWFAHPFDFDPCWLTSCDGFDPKVSPQKQNIKEKAKTNEQND